MNWASRFRSICRVTLQGSILPILLVSDVKNWEFYGHCAVVDSIEVTDVETHCAPHGVTSQQTSASSLARMHPASPSGCAAGRTRPLPPRYPPPELAQDSLNSAVVASQVASQLAQDSLIQNLGGSLEDVWILIQKIHQHLTTAAGGALWCPTGWTSGPERCSSPRHPEGRKAKTTPARHLAKADCGQLQDFSEERSPLQTGRK